MTKGDPKTYHVSALEQGTVLDHLEAGTALRAMRVLHLPPMTTVTVGINLRSGRKERKDLIKISNYELTQTEAAKVALISPDATLSIIRDYEIIRKTSLMLPEAFRGLLRCRNPSCIVHAEEIPAVYTVLGRRPVRVRCDYCETITAEDQFEFNR